MNNFNDYDDEPVVVGSDVNAAGRALAAFIVAIAALIGPVTVVVLVLTVGAVARQRSWHWHQVLRSALAFLVVVLVLETLVEGNPLRLHAAATAAWVTDFGHLGELVVQALLPSLAFGVPAGVVLGTGLLGLFERLAVGSEWHPLEQRRLEIVNRARSAQRYALLKTLIEGRSLPPEPLGTGEDGDLEAWRAGRFAVLGPELSNRGLLLVGAAGSGKTVSCERLVTNLAFAGRRVIFADCKSTDPGLVDRLVAAYLEGAGRSDIKVLVFPHDKLNGWVGEPGDIANRLIGTQEASEPYYAATLETAVRLAVGAPGKSPCASSDDFLGRLQPEFLTAAYKGTRRSGVVAALRQDGQSLRGVALRFEGLFEAIGGGFDGSSSWGDADLIILQVPKLAAPADAKAVMTLALSDFSNYCGDPKRKARSGDDLTLIIDEYSAITGLAPQVIDLAERVRDVGVQVIVSAQSWEGLGRDDHERRRVLVGLGSVLLHQCPDPEKFCELAGTVRRPEQSWQLEERSHSGLGSMRMGFRMKVDPDLVRRAGVGEAWAISGGRYLHLHVLYNPYRESLGEARRLLATRVLERAESAAVEDPERAESTPSDSATASRIEHLRRELSDDDD